MDSQCNSTFKDTSLPSTLKPKNHTPNPKENVIAFASDDKEISIFDAHKYFNEVNDPKSSHDLLSLPRLSYGRNFLAKSSRSTPTSSSEKSWNSQAGLLSNPSGSTGVSLNNLSSDQGNKWMSAVKKWFMGRKCCCNGEDSVQVKETSLAPESLSSKCSITDRIVEIHHIKAMAPSRLNLSSADFSFVDAPRQQRISASGRSFIDGAVGFTFPILSPSSDQTVTAKPIVDPMEDSVLEAFEPIHELPSMANLINGREDDVGSDASSDLFEIEGFSAQLSSYSIYRRRDAVDEDTRRFASAVDEPPASANEISTAEGARAIELTVSGDEGVEGKRKSNGLMLMSRRREKAVSVGPSAVNCMAEIPPPAGKPSLGRSHSSRLPVEFAA